ncbi:MAG: hypothetical protein K0Q72_2610, partial [Armatimonadetes bacterium]|nr:hypothetical protein [Armatimonadota bacterium]
MPTLKQSSELRDLQERFLLFQDANQLAPLLQAAEAAVVTRRAATESMLSPEPFYKERYRGGRWARTGETLSHPTGHGFDAEDRVVTIGAYYPTIFLYRPGFIEEIRHYEEERSVSVLQHYFLDEHGHVVRQISATSERLADTTYIWEG